MPAREGYRTGDQTHQRIQTQQSRHTNTNGVLHQQQANNHNQKDTHHAATRAQAGNIGVQADSGEECQHQRIAQGQIEVHFPTHAFFQHQQRNRHQQSASYRFGNGVFFQEGNRLDELTSQQQHKGCRNQR